MGENMDFSKETRRVYHNQHKRLANDDKSMTRYIGMFSMQYFGLDENYFVGKRILDAGCGDTVNLMIAVAKFGCTDLHGFDLGSEFLPVAKNTLLKYGVKEEHFTLNSASVLDIPYEDNYFDFVASHGVLLHLNNMNEVETAFRELARVTKPGGYLYAYVGAVGGIWEDALNPAIRQYYRTNAEFKKLIDNINPSNFEEFFELISKKIKEHTDEEIDLGFLKKYFDTDLCVTIQNVIQAPVRLAISEEFVNSEYKKYGFDSIRKLNRYVKRENIRKFLAPLHYEKEYFLSKILYGTGQSEFIAQKKN